VADVLPGYRYDTVSRRYRSDETGRFVSRADIVGLLEAQVASLERRLGALTQALHDGNLAPAWYAEQMRTELRRAHLQERALGAGGWHALTAQDYGSVGRRLRDDYARIVTLTQGIQEGTVTLPQALNRINGYVGTARLEFWEAERQRAQPSEASETVIMIRDLGTSEHCPSCLEYHSQGWAFDLPVPGTQSECGPRCRCSLRYRTVASELVGEWIGTRRQ
jgi:hypothetical protein